MERFIQKAATTQIQRYGEWIRQDEWYVMEAATTKPLEQLRSDAVRALGLGLAGVVTVHWWDGPQLCVRAAGTDGTLDFFPGRIRCSVRLRAFPATLRFFQDKILSDVSAALKDVNGAPHSDNKTVFIAHGRAQQPRLELRGLLANLGLTPLILDLQDDEGRTWIDKFEYYACLCSFAFVLLKPDDRMAAEQGAGEGRWRARQNAIMEMGWFMARLGRRRVAILHTGGIEIPSDMLGVASIEFKGSVTEVAEAIRLRLTGVGLIA
jgi:predicted nucleotide-binding protein